MKNSTLLAAGLLTAAICTLHFPAMGAATVQFDPTVIASYPQIDNKLLATAIAGVTLLVILSGLTAALINHDTARELKHRAEHDDLTGLPNRGFVRRMIETSINSGSSDFALLFLDLDHFKGINDKHGHVAGDHVLRQAAQRTQSVKRQLSPVWGAMSSSSYRPAQTGQKLGASPKQSFRASNNRLKFPADMVSRWASASASPSTRAMGTMENRCSGPQTKLFFA